MSRGGPHNRGRCLSHNTSGLNAIRFKCQHGTVYVCSAWYEARGQRQVAYSVSANGKSGALQRAIDRRKSAGFPTPSMSTALRALNRFLKEQA
jgi:hypothetical protein